MDTRDRDQTLPRPVAESMEPVVEALRAITPVARGLLWGNAASSMAGALRTISRSGIATDCVALGEELFADPPLKGAGEFVPFPGEVVFRRRSCCLYYRLPAGLKCFSCPLIDDEDRRRRVAGGG